LCEVAAPRTDGVLANHRHDYIGDPTAADAVCDRLLNNAHRLAKGSLQAKGFDAREK